MQCKIIVVTGKPISHIFSILFFETTLDSTEIYLIPRRVTVDTFTIMFQYKTINSALYLNKMLIVF